MVAPFILRLTTMSVFHTVMLPTADTVITIITDSGPAFTAAGGGDMAGAAIDGLVAAGEDVVGIKKAHPNRTTAL